MRTGIRQLACLLFAAMLIAGCAGTALAEKIKLAEKTPIKLKLLKSMTSGKVSVGEAVPLESTEDIKDPDGRILVAYGAKAIGKVTVSKKRGMLGKAGKLEFTLDAVQAVDGTSVPLRATMQSSGQGNNGAVIASALLLTVLAVFVNGRDITVKEGTEVSAYVDHETMIEAKSESKDKTDKPAVDAKVTVVSSVAVGTSIVGELRNDGPDACAVELIGFIKKDDKPVGAGTLNIDKLEANQTRAFSVPVEGSVDGIVSVSANVKPLATEPVAPATANTPAASTSPTPAATPTSATSEPASTPATETSAPATP